VNTVKIFGSNFWVSRVIFPKVWRTDPNLKNLDYDHPNFQGIDATTQKGEPKILTVIFS